MWESFPITKTAFSLLQDFYHNPAVLNYKPAHIAISCLMLSMQIYGVKVPLSEDSHESPDLWFKVNYITKLYDKMKISKFCHFRPLLTLAN